MITIVKSLIIWLRCKQSELLERKTHYNAENHQVCHMSIARENQVH